MNLDVTKDDCEKVRKLIDSCDLSAIIRRLVLIDKWTIGQAQLACKQYRNFLFLKIKYGKQYALPPSKDIDEVWHSHILHTEDYYHFCMNIFGEFLHHHPHHGKDNTISTQQLEKMFEEQTQRLYQEEFGEPVYKIRRFASLNKMLHWFNSLVGSKKVVQEIVNN